MTVNLVVASGKGGTGKTTVAVSLALVAAARRQEAKSDAEGPPNVVLIDCDVEEPNAHLFLDARTVERREVGILTPVVDAGRCNLCRRCAEVCAYHAIAILSQEVLLFPELCHGCGSCVVLCPEEAMREELRPTGVVEWGRVDGLALARGDLNVGEAMAGPVIREVKKYGVLAGPEGLVIYDSPPGTSCPVVETMRGADYALMVTEPTPFGLHDLRMAVDVARGQLGLRVGVVVNRDGTGYRGVEEYCRAAGVPVLLRIPLDRRIAQAYSDGIPLVQALPEYRDTFRHLLRRIEQEAAV